MTGGLSGIDGHEDDEPRLRTASRLPARLTGLAVAADGRPVGLDLPSLDARGAAEAWRAALGPGPFYVRFEDRGGEAAVGRVQRLSRLGEVWLDAPVGDVDAALDLLIAGAARLVLWGDDAQLLEAVGDSAVVGWDGGVPLERAVAAAGPHEAPILATAPVPAEPAPASTEAAPAPAEPAPVSAEPVAATPGPDQAPPPLDPVRPGLYQAPPRPWRGAFEVVHVGGLGDGDGE